MNKNNVLISLGLVTSMLFCMAFACGDGSEKDGAGDDDGEKTTRTATQDAADDDELPVMLTQAGVGKPYGARDPRRCAKTKAAGEKPTVAEAVASFICISEGKFMDNLYLVDDVKITSFGKGQRPDPKYHYSVTPDLSALAYDIRGSYKWYSCGKPSSLSQPEKNCSVYDEANAVGSCYKDTFGGWVCSMKDDSLDLRTDYTEVTPPRDTTAAR